MVNGDPATYPAVTGTVTGTPSTWIIPASEGPAPPLRASTGPSSRTPRLCSSVSSRPRSGVTGTVAIRISLDRTFPQLWKTDVHQRKTESSSGLPTLSRLPSLPLEVGAEPGDRPAPPRLVVEGARILDLAAALRVAGRGVEPDLLEAVEGTAGGEGADHHPGALVEVGANHHHGVEAGLVLPPAADQGCDLVVGHPSSPACTIFNALFPIMHTTGGGAQCASASSRRPRAAAA